MEQKQLDFNAPLLSVRRFSSTPVSSEEEKVKETVQEKRPVLPFYKSELKSGPLRNPGAVPFCWEQIPGRPKDEGRALLRPPERLPVAPKLPPGRTPAIKQQNLDKDFDKPDVNRHFNENVRPSAEKVLHSNDKVTKFDNSREGIKEQGSSDSGGSDDETFTDAMDTLSRTESFFLNCSVTGLSGFDAANMSKPSGTFSTDPQARDFMMNRFLPAAKAMASEAPQHTQRKKPATQEQPRELRMVINSEKRTPILKYKPYVEPQHVQDTEEEESEDEDDDDYDHGKDLSAKACGLLPRFCLKNSFCLLNPVPGMKVRSESPIRSVRKATTRIKSDNSESRSATDNENNWEAVYKHRLLSGLGSLYDESKRTSESNQLTWSDSQTPDGSSFRHSIGGGISPYRNEASQSPFHEGSGFLGMPKNVKHVKGNSLDRLNNTHHSSPESLSRYNNKRHSGSLNLSAEKTVYVDSEHLLDTPKSTLSSSDARELVECPDKGFGTPKASHGMEETLKEVSCVQDNNLTISNERAIIPLKTAEVIDTSLACSPDGSNRIECSSKACSLHQNSEPLDSKQQINGLLEFSQTQELIPYDHGESDLNSFQAPLPPPLPKSPSESWLWRTLPSIPSKNAARFVPRRQGLKTQSTDSKWEIIVKTSNV